MAYTDMFLLPAAAAILLLGWTLYALRNVGARPKGCPPGPPTLPILGNLHLLPKKAVHAQLQKWAQEYGPVYSLILGTKTQIILSSDQAVKDLLDKRSAIYSSRPEMYIIGDIARGSQVYGFEPYGKTWRQGRAVVHRILNVQAARSWAPYQELESLQLLVHFLDDPDNFVDHIAHANGSMSTQVVFGCRTADPNDWRHKYLVKSMGRVNGLGINGASNLLDIYPFLRNFPDWLVPARREAKEIFVDDTDFYMRLWKETKAAVKNGTAKPCFCTELAKAQDAGDFSDLMAAHTASGIHEAGYDTTSATLKTFVKAMVLFPDVARRGQEELDALCGDETGDPNNLRMPTLDDQASLPYIHGMMKEALRWCPVVTGGLPHATTEEDTYMGYRIPKGATIIQNTWAIHFDPARYPSPEIFDPLRFVGDRTTSMESASQGDPAKRDHFVFGSGRRICQGTHVAERTLFLAISRMLWGFDFAPVPGAPAIEPLEVTDTSVAQPAPFTARITSRSETRAEIIRREWKKAQEEKLDAEGQWKFAPEVGK